MIDIVRRLEATNHQVALDAADIIKQLRAQLRDKTDEVQTWRERYEAEKQDHEATMKAWDEERSGL
jgi:hypothetical protein